MNRFVIVLLAVGLAAAPTHAIDVEEDGAPVCSASTLNFLEPDATLVVENPSTTAEIQMDKYALLAGRAGGQTLLGAQGPSDESEGLFLDATDSGILGAPSYPQGVVIGKNITSIAGKASGVSVAFPDLALDASTSTVGVLGYTFNAGTGANPMVITGDCGDGPPPDPDCEVIIAGLGSEFVLQGTDDHLDLTIGVMNNPRLLGKAGSLSAEEVFSFVHTPTLYTSESGSVAVDVMGAFVDQPTAEEGTSIGIRAGFYFKDLQGESPRGTQNVAVGVFIEDQTIQDRGWSFLSRGDDMWMTQTGQAMFGPLDGTEAMALEPVAQVDTYVGDAGRVGRIITARSGQTADLDQWKDSSGNVLTSIDANGFFNPKSSADSSAPNNALYYSTDLSKLAYKDPGGTVHALY